MATMVPKLKIKKKKNEIAPPLIYLFAWVYSNKKIEGQSKYTGQYVRA